MVKKAIIINCFDNYTYNVRSEYVEKCLTENGYECMVLAADFDHRNRKKYKITRNRLKLISVPEYNKNISIRRIYSHYIFSRKVLKEIKREKPEFIYACLPPNFMTKYVAKYRQNNNTILVFDVVDMWPETLPLSVKKRVLISPILRIWASLRNRYLSYSDGIVFECDLFRQYLKCYQKNVRAETIYLCKKDKNIV